MDQATRKANLKKLQLPSTSGYKQRKTRQTATTTANTAIKKYFFLTPEKHNNHPEEITNGVNKHSPTVLVDLNEAPQSSTGVRTRAKRTKLDAFIFKDSNSVPNSIKKVKKSLNDDDFVEPEKKAKKAPKLSQTKSTKSSRAKRQTTIKSAFLRNEQLFAEIAAQHCAADQFDGDDVQLALAISKSEADSKGIRIAGENVIKNENAFLDGNDNDAESIREKLKKYGFRTAETKDYNTFANAFLPKFNNRRTKSKWANRFTPLTLRNSENQMKKLHENTEKLLNSQFRTKTLSDHEKLLPHYKIHSSLLKNSKVHENKRILQTNRNIYQSYESYFVKELFEINRLPAGYLLKDWSTIQGRDLSPNSKNKQSIENIKILENLYGELAEYFRSRKILDWSTIDDKEEDQVLSVNSDLNSSKVSNKEENIELNKMVELIEQLQKDEESDNENAVTSLCSSANDRKILQLLQTTKTLDRMQVSSCTINTQATVNSTQKNRSNSPDLFADSDVEMEETDKDYQNDETEETVINLTKDKTRKNSLDCIRGDDVVTYEIFSSDEVKNTCLLESNKSVFKELSPNISHHTSNVKVIDLTQEEFQISTSKIPNDQSRPIEEIDLFAESPTEEAHMNTEEEEEEAVKFTLSMELSDKERQIIEKEMEETFPFTPSSATKEQLPVFKAHQEVHNEVLREIAMDQSNTPLLNFKGSKQLETSFHRKTITETVQTDIRKDNLKDNDTIFRELCNKYLKRKPANRSNDKKLEQVNDIKKSFSQILPDLKTPQRNLNVLETKDNLKKSYSQIIPTMKTPQKYDNMDFTMDLDISFDKNLTFKRKSLPFTAESPLKLDTNDCNTILPKSLNKCHSNVSIDLTQNDIDEENNKDVDDYDDCIVLSDDEINYSIWQANKSLKLQTSIQLSQDQEDTTSLPGNENNNGIENIIEFPDQNDHNAKFAYLDSKEEEKLEESLIKICLEPEQSISDFEILRSKYATFSTPGQNEFKFDRSEFGILEEYSQSLDHMPNHCTPTKVLTEASFLSSPTETAAPMKLFSRCHRSSQKFQDLINNIESKSPPCAAAAALDDLSHFDEFDRFTYTSPLKSLKSNKKPQGIDKLLTAEINFKDGKKQPETTKKRCSVENTTQEIKCNNKIYTVRYCSSPKPDYTKYTEAELLKELYNFGIKRLKRNQAVKILEYIYNQTHPIIMEPEGDDYKQQQDIITLDGLDRPSTSKDALKSKTQEHFTTATTNKSDNDRAGSNLLHVASKKLNLQDSCGRKMLRYSVDLKAELYDENYILQTNVTKKTPQPLLPFHIAWYNLVCSNQNLHENILMYEPIDLQEIYLFLKSLGYRYDPKDLKIFFDRRCIIFRYDIASVAGSNAKTKDTNRHVRKSKKTNQVLT